jgi:hypothetical protein
MSTFRPVGRNFHAEINVEIAVLGEIDSGGPWAASAVEQVLLACVKPLANQKATLAIDG